MDGVDSGDGMKHDSCRWVGRFCDEVVVYQAAGYTGDQTDYDDKQYVAHAESWPSFYRRMVATWPVLDFTDLCGLIIDATYTDMQKRIVTL